MYVTSIMFEFNKMNTVKKKEIDLSMVPSVL